jgi:phytoene dehydrogenase-like protein
VTNSKRIAIVGAGHNALVCACYLAKAGHDITVFERRSRVGGAVNTEEMWGGYMVDTCSVMHILIHKTPIVRELQLERFGLEYMQMDPWGFAPFLDGSHIVFYKDLDRTCQSIAAISERDAEAYRRFVLKWHQFNQAIFEMFVQAPAPGAAIVKIARRASIGQIRSGGKGDPDMSGLELLRKVAGNYGKMLDETFASPQLKAAIAWMAAQSGPPPSEVGSGALAGAHSLYHDVGATHPRGGSGLLSQALARCLEHHGGSIRCNAPVRRIVTAGNRVRGIELQDGERVGADIVVSGAHIRTTMLELVDRQVLPAALRPKLQSLRTGNGTGMTLRCAIDELPEYLACGGTKDEGRRTKDEEPATTDNSTPSAHQPATGNRSLRTTHYALGTSIHSAMQLICPSIEYLRSAYEDAQRGRPARHPALVAMTPSAVDPTVAPPGKHSLYIWAQYHPYALSGGESWDHIREREADLLVEILAQYAPNVATAITHRYIQTPLDLERNVGLLRGNIMHIDMSLDQMFMFRPLPELSGYGTPIPGLYLTGASTHPGGGVSGASGRNAASAVLSDLQKRRLNWRGAALGAAALAAVLASRRRTKDEGKT